MVYALRDLQVMRSGSWLDGTVWVAILEFRLADRGLQRRGALGRRRVEQARDVTGDELLHRDQFVDEFRADLQGAGFPRAVLAQVHARGHVR